MEWNDTKYGAIEHIRAMKTLIIRYSETMKQCFIRHYNNINNSNNNDNNNNNNNNNNSDNNNNNNGDNNNNNDDDDDYNNNNDIIINNNDNNNNNNKNSNKTAEKEFNLLVKKCRKITKYDDMSFLESETHIGKSLTAEVHSEPHQISKLEAFCEKYVRIRSYSGPHFSRLFANSN